jgi:Uma2 family endonuclease
MITYTINFDPVCKFTDEQFYQLCRKNPEIKFERNARGEIVIMSPTGGKNGNRNAEIMIEFGIWNRQTNLVRYLILLPVSDFPTVAVAIALPRLLGFDKNAGTR